MEGDHGTFEFPSEFVFEKMEIWTADLTVQRDSKNETMVKTLGLLSDKSKVWNHPWCEWNAYSFFRSNPIFYAPKNLTVVQLSNIVFEAPIKLNMRLSKEVLDNETTLEELHEHIEERPEANGIVDLEFETAQLIDVNEEEKNLHLQKKSSSKDEVLAGYIPKMGVFDAFELQGGVKVSKHGLNLKGNNNCDP